MVRLLRRDGKGADEYQQGRGIKGWEAAGGGGEKGMSIQKGLENRFGSR